MLGKSGKAIVFVRVDIQLHSLTVMVLIYLFFFLLCQLYAGFNEPTVYQNKR